MKLFLCWLPALWCLFMLAPAANASLRDTLKVVECPSSGGSGRKHNLDKAQHHVQDLHNNIRPGRVLRVLRTRDNHPWSSAYHDLSSPNSFTSEMKRSESSHPGRNSSHPRNCEFGELFPHTLCVKTNCDEYASVTQQMSSESSHTGKKSFQIRTTEFGELEPHELHGLPNRFRVLQSSKFSVQSSQDSIPADTLTQVAVIQQIANKYIPLPHTIIKPAALLRDDGVQLAPALNRVAGVVMQTGTLSTNRVVIRGIGSRSTFSTNKLRAYLDDIPLTDGSGETAIEDIDLSLLSEVRVFKGPTASLYGAGLGGLILLRSEQPQATETKLKFTTQTTVGSFGLLRNATHLNFQSKRTHAWLNYNITHQDGWRQNSRYDRSGLSAFVRHDWGRFGTSSVLLQGLNHLRAFIPSSLNINDFRDNPSMANPAWLGVQGNENTNKNLIGFQHSVNYLSYKKYRLEHSTSLFLRSRNSLELRPFNTLDEKSISQGVRSQIKLIRKDASQLPFPVAAVGVEHMTEAYDWATSATSIPTENEEKRRITNFFAQSYFRPLPKVRTLVGVNLNTTRYNTLNNRLGSNPDSDTGSYTYNPILSPHIGITWQVHRLFQAFGTVSHGFSAPTLAETLTPDGQINPNISPETGLNREIGFRLQNRFLQAELSYHDMLVRNLLVAERVGQDQYVGINAGRTRHRGLEADVHTSFNGQVNGFATYTYTHYRFIDFTNREVVYDGNALPGVAPHHLQLGVDWVHSSGVFANFSTQYMAAYPINDANTIDNEAFTVAHLQAGYRRAVGKTEIELRGGVQNIFDKRYASMTLVNANAFGGALPRYYYPGAPSGWYFGLVVHR